MRKVAHFSLMGHRDQQEEENEIVRNLAYFPTFLNGTTFVRGTKDPPDFIGRCVGGQKIGVELTSWLHSSQTRDADGRKKMRKDILRIIDLERFPHPVNFSSVVVMPQWGKRIRESHYQRFRDEFYAAARHTDGVWKALRERHWRSLRPEERFDYEAHQSDLKLYPTLCRYIDSIWFTEGIESDQASNENSWVSIIPDGGIYDPVWSIQALRNVIERKIRHYSNRRMQAHLDAQDLEKLYLLVFAPAELSSSNTSYQTGGQMMVSPVEGLTDAAKAAVESLSVLPKVFDGIFLFYPVWNSRWLARIWPTFQGVPCVEA